MSKIGLVGQISVGKTTLINTLLENYIGKTEKKHSTSGVVYYHNSEKVKTQEEVSKELELSEEEITHVYLKLPLFGDKKITLIDIPGLDSEKTLNSYHKIISDLDLIIFVTDCNNSFNNSLEKKLYSNIIKRIHKNWTHYKYSNLITVYNKYDDSEDEEINDNINQSKTFLDSLSIEKNIFKISGIKLMVKNILETNNYQMNLVPKHILKTIFKQFYGLHKTKNILELDHISNDELKEMSISNDELNFMNSLLKFINPTFTSELIMSKFEHVLKNTFFDTEDYIKVIKIIKAHSYLQKSSPSKFNMIVNNLFINDMLVDTTGHNLEDYEQLLDFIFLKSDNLYEMISTDFTPEEIIKKLINENKSVYDIETLINFCRKYDITNIMQFIKTEDLNNLIQYKDDISDLIPFNEKEKLYQFEDYQFIKELLDKDYCCLGLKVNFYMYPEKFTRIILNYINLESLDNFISDSSIILQKKTKNSEKVYGSIFDCMGKDDFTYYESTSTKINIIPEKYHLYPDYVKIWLQNYNTISEKIENNVNNINKVLDDNKNLENDIDLYNNIENFNNKNQDLDIKELADKEDQDVNTKEFDDKDQDLNVKELDLDDQDLDDQDLDDQDLDDQDLDDKDLDDQDLDDQDLDDQDLDVKDLDVKDLDVKDLYSNTNNVNSMFPFKSNDNVFPYVLYNQN